MAAALGFVFLCSCIAGAGGDGFGGGVALQRRCRWRGAELQSCTATLGIAWGRLSVMRCFAGWVQAAGSTLQQVRKY